MEKTSVAEDISTFAALSAPPFRPYSVSDGLSVPAYLEATYWWAYLHPRGVWFFERQWLVNLILWGNFSRLRDEALTELGTVIDGRVLQVACVYGDFTQAVAQRLSPGAHLDVVDVATVQLDNVHRKLRTRKNVDLYHQDSTDIKFASDSYDRVVVFFLLHEQPDGVRKKTVNEALRVVKPGGKVIFVDYHCPHPLNPFRYIMAPILRLLEPFAMDTWQNEITDWVNPQQTLTAVRKETFFGGLYQKVVMTK